jgi:hypothetical protein
MRNTKLFFEKKNVPLAEVPEIGVLWQIGASMLQSDSIGELPLSASKNQLQYNLPMKTC